MPDDRFFHKRLGHSAKVNSLTDFEFRVWVQYQLSADDCGVMRHAAVAVQADNDALAARPVKAVQRALDRLVAVGLLLEFAHQGLAYVCQGDWQNFQRIRYPRPAMHPCPSSAILAKCTSETMALFRIRHGKRAEQPLQNSGDSAEESPQSSGNIPEPAPQSSGNLPVPSPQVSGKVSETFPSPTRAGVYERHTANGNGLRQEATARARAVTGSGVMAGALPRDHVRHAHCGRVCVPEFLHAEFLPKLGGDADARLQAFYVATLAAIPDDQDIGDEPPKFWRAHFARAFGIVAPTGPKGLTVEELLADD